MAIQIYSTQTMKLGIRALRGALRPAGRDRDFDGASRVAAIERKRAP